MMRMVLLDPDPVAAADMAEVSGTISPDTDDGYLTTVMVDATGDQLPRRWL